MVNANWPTDEEQAQYELAQNMIRDMVGIRSSWIGEESRKQDKDEERIAIWRAEQAAFGKEKDNLDPKNAAQLQSVIDHYGPVLRIAYAKTN